MRGFLSLRRFILLSLAILPVAAFACSSDVAPTPTVSTLPDGLITQDQAVITALQHVSFSGPGITPMAFLHNPVAELVIYTRGQNTKPVTGELLPDERYAWVVQIEGESQSVPMVRGGDVHTYSYAIVYVDAMTNSHFTSRRTNEPYFQ